MAKKRTEIPSIISAGIAVKGDIETEGEVQYDGVFEGDLKCGRIIIGESAEIRGNIYAEDVIIHGTVNGRVFSPTVILHPTAVINGDITHTTLNIEPGARMNGQCIHSDDPLEKEATSDSLEKPANAEILHKPFTA